MRVSVLIPSYNRGYILGDAISSVLAQTHRDYEIVVVDDGSTDNTEEVVKQFSGAGIRYVRHETNRGYSAACNTAIRAADGEALGFLDSDDQWKPNYLERQVSFLSRHPEADAVFSDVEIVAREEMIPSLIALMRSFPRLLHSKPLDEEYVLSPREMRVCLLEEVPIKPTALVVRRELYDKAGLFDESWPSGTDWELFLRFSQFATFGYIDLPLAVQKWTSDATHRRYWEQDKVFLLGVSLEEKRKLRNDPDARRAVNRAVLNHCSNLAYVYQTSSRRSQAIATYLKGFRETGAPGMLLRAAAAVCPQWFTDRIRHIVRSARGWKSGDAGRARRG
jgi:glycosyltransferase involved in cell wall biosynthesis